MDFFVWQDGRGVNSPAIDDDPNAARRKKTRFHGALWVGIGISHSQTGSGYLGARSVRPQTTDERVSAPELSKPCPSCPDNIGHQVFQGFIEQGTVPDDLSDVVKLGIWCMQHGEPKALAHLFEHGHISTADFKLGG